MNPSPDETFSQTLKGFGTLVERLTPWLLDLGSWIFGALIAFNLLVLASLLTVGPIDAAVLIATLAIGLGLPPAVAGFFVLRLVEDVKKVRLEDMAADAFREAGFRVEEQFPAPEAMEALVKRRTKTVLIYSYAILVFSVLLTVAGITAALWHMAWWVSLAFLLMMIVSGGAVIAAMAGWPSGRRKLST